MPKKTRLSHISNKTKLLAALLAALIIAVLSFGFAYADEFVPGSTSHSDVNAADYNGKRLGTIPGSLYENDLNAHFPDSPIYYYQGVPELYTALVTNKIDGFAMSEVTLDILSQQHSDVTWLPEVLSTRSRYFGFAKNEKGERLRDQFNEMLAEFKADGTLEELENIWYGSNESRKVIDKSGITGENGVIYIGVNSVDEPYNYVRNDERVGINMALVFEFIKRYGYSLEYSDAQSSSLLVGLYSGKYDMLATALSYTDERAESMLFSDPVLEFRSVLAVRTSDIDSSSPAAVIDDPASENRNLIERIVNSFEKNFIREGRWKMVLRGIGVTCLLTVLAGLFGTIIGFLICMARRTGSRIINIISNIYVRLLIGTPIVVLLLLLYYVVFGKCSFDSIWVGVIGFSLNFGAYVSEIIQSGINSIDRGQHDAALALGYSENKAFFKFVFPQAAVKFLPVYTSELVSLMKSTSIVGYIAIQDLTTVSDLIRSRTYEALFPLAANAAIYFILAWIITSLLALLMKRIDPRKNAGT